MRRRDSLAALLLLAGALAPRGQAQQSAKPVRIGFLSSESAQAWAPRIEALRAGLRDFGFVEHRNLVIEYRWAEGRVERLPALADELVASRPEVIVAGAAPASRAAKLATSTIPIVMVAVGDIVEFGLVPNLSRPGGNVTGSTFFNLELTAKRVELLKDAFPRLRRAAFLLNPESVGSEVVLGASMKAADALKLTLQKFEVTRAEDFVRSFSAIAREKFEAVLIPNQPLMNTNMDRIATLAEAHRLPSIGGTEFADAGCLLGYGINFPDLYRSAAATVDKIIKGARPGDIPIDRAMRFDFVVNRKTASALGVSIPNAVLVRADRVIE